MIGKIQAYVEQNQMIAPQSHVVAGVSGGADSVCLLFVLGEIKKRLPFTMEAVHINHKLREEAEDDAAFVGEICAQLGVSLRVFAADVGEMARAKGLSLEEAGRDYRYECLRMVANEHEAGIIAVAHHLDDRAETLLFNLFRGSGLKGLAGIRPVRGDIIRPLLGCTRQEIEAYLAERGIPYRIDPSNASEANTRSFIRQQIMPRAKEVNPAAVENMAKTADLAAEAERFVREQARAAFRECAGVYRSERAIYNRPYVGMSTIAPVCRGGCQPPVTHIEINIDKLHTFDPFLQKYVLLLAFEELSPGRQGIALPHVTDVLELAQGGGSKELHLPYGLRAYKEYERLVLGYSCDSEGYGRDLSGRADVDIRPYELHLGTPETGDSFTVPGLGKIAYRTFPHQKNMKFPQKTYTKWFDCGKITSSALLRRRERGDYLIINSAGQRKKLSDYLIDEKIPKARRGEMYVLADGAYVMWVCGFRISEYYKVTDKTKTVLEVTIGAE